MHNRDSILGDLTVLDVSQGIPGPYCTKLLAALGARVIKVESSKGDVARSMGPFFHDEAHPEKSGLFLYLNTSKESITLNLDAPAGAALFKRLVPMADIVVESYSPGTMAGWGLGYSDLAVLKPDLIYTSVTDFGQTGPYRDYRGSDLIAQAVGCLLVALGLPEREPLKLGGNPVLITGGMAAFSASMVALHHRDETGEGQHVDVSLMETVALGQIHTSVHAQFGEIEPSRRPSTMSKAKDGWVNLGIQQNTWKPFCELIDRPDLIDDQRFVNTEARREHMAALNAIIEGWLANQTKEEVYHKVQAIRSVAGYVADVADLFHSAQYQSREFFQQIDHPMTGPIYYAGPVFRVGDEPWRQERAPLLGEHNELVYHRELDISEAEMRRLGEQGVI